ncbi:hypothetical protein EVAR_39711_1 [Eumeta japonica]|uniref:Uncharacterized protein n=1 Tax=Eumeta variegata TaxID=151549 RepID=A0A4C1W847_EUMVA|nr:hypothetical protein EVAR_39711_1 [Eumeta japonica]
MTAFSIPITDSDLGLTLDSDLRPPHNSDSGLPLDSDLNLNLDPDFVPVLNPCLISAPLSMPFRHAHDSNLGPAFDFNIGLTLYSYPGPPHNVNPGFFSQFCDHVTSHVTVAWRRATSSGGSFTSRKKGKRVASYLAPRRQTYSETREILPLRIACEWCDAQFQGSPTVPSSPRSCPFYAVCDAFVTYFTAAQLCA